MEGAKKGDICSRKWETGRVGGTSIGCLSTQLRVSFVKWLQTSGSKLKVRLIWDWEIEIPSFINDSGSQDVNLLVIALSLLIYLFMVLNTGHRNGLLSLYKDMESCGEYADIQVMWKMIESSSPQYACCHKKRINRSSYWVVCFRPTWTVFWVVSFSWWDEFTCFKYDRWVYKRREIKIFLMSVPFLQPLYLPSHHYQRKSKWMIKVYIWISCRSQYLLSLVYILGLGLDFVF